MGRTAWINEVEQVARAIARYAVNGAAKTACNAMIVRVTVRMWSVRRARRQTRPGRR